MDAAAAARHIPAMRTPQFHAMASLLSDPTQPPMAQASCDTVRALNLSRIAWLVGVLFLLVASFAGPNGADASDGGGDGAPGFVGLSGVVAEIQGFGRDASESADLGRPRLFAGATNALGHWRFVDASGRQVTAEGTDEVAAAFRWMAPTGASVPADGPSGILLVPLETARSAPEVLRQVPSNLTLAASVGGRHIPVLLADDGTVYGAAAQRVLVPLLDTTFAAEILWHLRRPFGQSSVVLLSLDADSTPEARPPNDGIAKPTDAETADKNDASEAAASTPLLLQRVVRDRLATVFADLAERSVILTGQVASDHLEFADAVESTAINAEDRPGGSKSHRIALSDLRAMAERQAIHLMVIDTGATAQPGETTYLWRARALAGLDDAAHEPTLARMLDALSTGAPLVVKSTRVALVDDGDGASPLTTPETTGAVTLAVRPAPELAALVRQSLLDDAGALALGLWTDLVATTTDDLSARGFQLVLPTQATLRERQLRILPGIPAVWQLAYLGLLAVGLVGAVIAWQWWRAGLGLTLAGLTSPLFLLVVVPALAPISAPVQMWVWLQRIVRPTNQATTLTPDSNHGSDFAS